MFVLVTHLPTGMHPPSNGFTELPCWTVTDSHIDTAVEKKACVFAHSVSLPKSSKGQRNGSGRNGGRAGKPGKQFTEGWIE